MIDTPETDKAERMAFGQEYMVPTEFARDLERQLNELATKLEDNKQSLEVAISDAQSLENAIDIIMAAPLPDILRLFRERGILATMTTTAKEGAK